MLTEIIRLFSFVDLAHAAKLAINHSVLIRILQPALDEFRVPRIYQWMLEAKDKFIGRALLF